jgi:putative nucleotidyltransferase with HDIG domain
MEYRVVDMSSGNENSHHMNPQQLVKDIQGLVSLPDICIRLNAMIERDEYSAAEISKVISQDTNLTARLLKIANSAFYGFPSRVETISRAITIIGNRELRDLVLATSAVEAFDKIPIDRANMTSFWTHSIHCGIVGRILASKCGILHKERLFVAGLLHDIGHLVFYLKLPDLARKAMLSAAAHNRDIYLEEQDIIGYDHALVGGELLQSWNLPQSLVEPVKYHHEPALTEKFCLDASIVHIANIVSKQTALNNYVVGFNDLRFADLAIKLTKLDETLFEQILSETRLQVAEALTLFLPKAS